MKPQEEEIEAAAWVPLEHYTEQDTFQAELYQQVREQRVHRCNSANQGPSSMQLQGRCATLVAVLHAAFQRKVSC